jgi:BirA family biotin operon repressor/biotin-[acetyl-CoA-carboxylase] ligase
MHPYSIIKLPSVDSTNIWAKNAVANRVITTNAVIVAETQTNGRGQMQTIWHDAPGENLLFTLVFKPKYLKATHFFKLNEAVSTALIEAISETGIKKAQIKWPNDILIDKRKVAGTLIETSIKGEFISRAYIGIGLNVNQMLFDKDFAATSLALQTGSIVDKEVFLDDLLSQLNLRLGNMSSEKNELDYLKNLLGFQSTLRYEDAHGEFLAQIIRIEDNGTLTLQVKGETEPRKYQFKQVKWLGYH